MSILTKIFGDANEKEMNQLKLTVEQINQLEPAIGQLSDGQLKEKTADFKKRLKNGAVFDDILPEAFAVAREAARRVLGERAFDTQLMTAIVFHQGKVAELKTGEGKTLAIVLAAYLNALEGKSVHVVTVNDYLARRDTNWMGPVYHLLGVSCGCLNHAQAYLFEPKTEPDKDEASVEMENLKKILRKDAYVADVTYGTNNEFGFDYLRDNMAPALEAMVQKGHHFAIIDEVDSILIDEARTPLIISMPDVESTKMYEKFSRIVPKLRGDKDYNIDEKRKIVTLTEEGIANVEKILGMGNIYQEGGIRYVHHLEQALRADVLFKKDRDYVVKNNQVMIVDEFTGRLMPGRRYSEGLHQALEAKENVSVQQESRTLASITFQNYFRMYEKLAGGTGTAATSAEEFQKVYGLDVAIMPTNKPLIRKDLEDSIYKTEKGKWLAVVGDIKEKHERGRPVLVGTVSIEKNELLSAHLKKEGIPHQILNAKNHEQEAQIIAEAGRQGAVTVATNMAGRGVDIVLGGIAQGPEQGRRAYNLGGQPGDDKERWQQAHDKVVHLGGLHVIGTERHEARRIDDQLRGRSGRQGDLGSSQFFVSLEDDLMRVFGGEKVKSLMDALKVPEDQPIENKMVSRAIASAQAKVEGFHFDMRKHVLEYDDVVNKQRETIYTRRRDILKRQDLKSDFVSMIEKEMASMAEFHTQAQNPDEWNRKEIAEVAMSVFGAPKDFHERLKDKKRDEIRERVTEAAKEAYEKKEAELKPENMRKIEKFILLRNLDGLWMNHLDDMEHLRDSVRLRAYGQKDPLVEYKNEGMRLFRQLLAAIQSTAVNTIFKVGLAPAGESAVSLRGAEQRGHTGPVKKGKIGRNDPCPCGSGKKYKKCHGQ